MKRLTRGRRKPLLRFGDRDGYGSSARLQLPVGISPMTEEKLLVADTYNHKIRAVFPEENECRAFSGYGLAGYKDGPKEVRSLRDQRRRARPSAEHGMHGIRSAVLTVSFGVPIRAFVDRTDRRPGSRVPPTLSTAKNCSAHLSPTRITTACA